VAPKKDKLDPREIEREYGFAYEFFKSDPELWQLLRNAIDGNWSDVRFAAALKDTKWYRKHSDVWRQVTALKYSDPATYRERVNNMRTQIGNLAGQFGADLTNKELNRLAERALLFGWSPDQVLNHIAKDVRPSKSGQYGGELSGIQDRLEQTAFRNGIKLEKKQLQKWMRQIVRGEADVNQFENYIRKIAAQTFGAYGSEIKAGMDAIEVAAPYMQSMADILEMNPASINLFDKTIRRALSYKNEKGETVPMSITTFEDELRKDKRFQYTDGAREQLKAYAIELGKMWGVLT
jgi:hypothetical protein